MLSVGVIGTGSMGQNHARVYSEIAQLAGIADIDAETVNRLSTKFSTTGYTDYKKMLALDELDAVSVATPSGMHYDVAKAALNAGKHVLVEKPITNNVAHARELIDIAHDAGLTFSVGHIERHNPIVGFAKDMIKRKAVGDVLSLASRRVSSFPRRIRDVGVIFDLGIHDIDIIRYLAGSEVTGVYSVAGMFNNDQFEDYANIMMEFEDGKIGFSEVNWLTPMRVRRSSMTCSDGFVELDYMTQSLQVSKSTLMDFDVSDMFQIPQKYDIRKMSVRMEEPLKNELEDFLRAVETKSAPLVTGEDGLRALQIADAAVASGKSKQKIELD